MAQYQLSPTVPGVKAFNGPQITPDHSTKNLNYHPYQEKARVNEYINVWINS